MLLQLAPSAYQNQALLAEIPPGREGVKQTLRVMAQLARHAVRDTSRGEPIVRALARRLTRDLNQKDKLGEIFALGEFVRDRIRYVGDIRGVETLQTPQKTLELASGDCDDKATLLAALLESINHPARFHAVGFRPGQLSHVYTEARYGRGWLPLETTEPHPMGWVPPGAVEHMIYTI